MTQPNTGAQQTASTLVSGPGIPVPLCACSLCVCICLMFFPFSFISVPGGCTFDRAHASLHPSILSSSLFSAGLMQPLWVRLLPHFLFPFLLQQPLPMLPFILLQPMVTGRYMVNSGHAKQVKSFCRLLTFNSHIVDEWMILYFNHQMLSQ